MAVSHLFSNPVQRIMCIARKDSAERNNGDEDSSADEVEYQCDHPQASQPRAEFLMILAKSRRNGIKKVLAE